MSDIWARPCVDKNHAMCGCTYREQRCCLACPLPKCILDTNQPKRRRRPHSRAAQRGALIIKLLAQGRAPTSIRRELGISRIQYIRAVQWKTTEKAVA